MAQWTGRELDRIGGADELDIAAARSDGTLRRHVPIWVIRVGDDLYVRSYRGCDGAWYRHLLHWHDGHIRSGGVERDVTVQEVGDDLNPAIDQAYRAKYTRYGDTYLGPMISSAAQATTLRRLPR